MNRHEAVPARPPITREQASRRLLEVINACDPTLLRAPVGEVLWQAHEYAEMAGDVRARFQANEVADASFAIGVSAVERELGPHVLIRHLDSRAYKVARAAVIARTSQPETRSLVFFTLGLSLGLHGQRHRH
jgi:hypothetical protein